MAAIWLGYLPRARAPCSRHRAWSRGGARPGGTGSMGRLAGKVALISGTARGMGRAAALEFAAQGAAVFGCDLDADGSAETVELVTKAGGQMAALAPVSLSSAEGARSWVDAAVGRFGGVDVLYN